MLLYLAARGIHMFHKTGCLQQKNIATSSVSDTSQVKSSQRFRVSGSAMASELSQLQRVQLKDLHVHVSPGRANQQMKGVAVICYLAGEPTLAFGDMILASVKDGTTLSSLMIHRGSRAGSSRQQVASLFPVGVKVAIKEPIIVAPGSRIPVMAVTSCAGVECMEVMGIPEALNTNEVRKLGNEAYVESQFTLARLYYTECYNRASQTVDKVLALSNRAEAGLKMGRFDEAVSDAQKALELDPTHAKSFLRKARGLSAIQEHKRALEFTKLAMQHASSTDISMISDFERSCQDLLYQSDHPEAFEHIKSKYLLEGVIPECVSDYVGPVIVSTSVGRGRGLFVTQDVSAGELLLVSNCIGIAERISKPITQSLDGDLETEVIKACSGNSRQLAQLYALDTEGDVLPNMAIYHPNAGSMFPTGSYNSIDAERVKRIVDVHAIAIGGAWMGIWSLLCFINHSCVPNADFIRAGNVAFVHANRDLKAGEELFISYVEALLPWDVYRKNRTPTFGFSCKCKRCVLESSNAGLLPQVNFESIDKLIKPAVGSARSTIKLLEKGLSEAKHLSEEEKCWIRASYVDLYFEAGRQSCLRWLVILNTVSPGNLRGLRHMFGALAVARESGEDVSEEVKKMLRKTCIGGFGKMDDEVLDKLIRKFIDSAGQDLLKVKLGTWAT